MTDHVGKFKEGIKQIKQGFDLMSGGPTSFTLDVLLAAYTTLVGEYARFRVGQRVTLRATPHAAENKGSGWWHCRHFMVPGATATVHHVSCDNHGNLRYDVEFDRETWIDRVGEEQPVIAKHVFSFFEKELDANPHMGFKK